MQTNGEAMSNTRLKVAISRGSHTAIMDYILGHGKMSKRVWETIARINSVRVHECAADNLGIEESIPWWRMLIHNKSYMIKTIWIVKLLKSLDRGSLMTLAGSMDYEIHSAISEVDKVGMDESFIQRLLHHDKNIIRALHFRNLRDYVSDEEIGRYMSHSDDAIRFNAIRHLVRHPSDSEIYSGLRDPDYNIRMAWALNSGWKADKSHAFIGIRDPRARVRSAWMRRRDWTPDCDDIQVILQDPDAYIVKLLLSREDWMEALSDKMDAVDGLRGSRCAHFSEDQIMSGLTDSRMSVRLAWAESRLWTPSEHHVDLGVKCGDICVRLAWAERMDYVPTEEQVKIGLNDVDEDVSDAWKSRYAFMLDSVLGNVEGRATSI